MNNYKKSNGNSKDYNKQNKKKGKRMPVWLLVITDILLAASCLGVLLLYQIVLPQKLTSANKVVATAADSVENTFELPDAKSNNTKSSKTSNDTDKNLSNSKTSDIDNTTDSDQLKSISGLSVEKSRQAINGNYTNYTNTNTNNITSNKNDSKVISSEKKTVTKVNSYRNNRIEFTTSKIEMGSGNDKITYYLSDIYVTSVKYIKTAFATKTFGKNLTDTAADIAKENNALLAISGDFYGNSETSFVIRNGILYRNKTNDADICVLFTNGVMKTYSPENFNADEVIKDGAWQAWTFGPALLDDNSEIPDSFNTTDYLYGDHPRSVLGYVKPGHYVFVTVDGRNPGYSRGVNLNELAQIMIDAGCSRAYNLDGGKSAAMLYKDQYVNQPAQGGREISDIIYVGE